jgi:hypothetical protein
MTTVSHHSTIFLQNHHKVLLRFGHQKIYEVLCVFWQPNAYQKVFKLHFYVFETQSHQNSSLLHLK